ncbi:hypothetical protein [Streptomyces radiopugnans]|uniref:hypothetical protein n=1 Tax=Streptomyces radiopugnans TaxID=403935 RepID=UPI003F1A566F
MKPAVGSYVVDSRSDRVGQVTGAVGGLVRLRPPGGGPAWDCPADALRPAGTCEELRARVTEINRDRTRRLP